MLIFSALFLAADFCINKIYQRKNGTSPSAGFIFNAFLGLFTAIIFLAANGFKLTVTPFSAVMALLMGGVVMGYNLVGFRLLKSGSLALYTLFLMTGGMVIPYVYGLVCLDEPFSILRTAALVLILFGVAVANNSGEKANIKQLIMCLLVFLLNGASSIVTKVHQIELNFETVSATEFVILTGFAKFIVAGILYLFSKKEVVLSKANVLTSAAIIFASAAASGVAYLLLLLGAAALPATVMYPFISGGSIAFSAIAGIIFFKDRLSKRVIFSSLLCIFGMIIFAF